MDWSASRRAARVPIVASLACALALAGRAAADVTLDDCGGFTEFTRIPGVGTFPDTNTLVYQAAYAANSGNPGAFETVVSGRPPKARYWSFAVIDQARREIANLSDFEIVLDPAGGYEVHIRQGCTGVPNCLDLS